MGTSFGRVRESLILACPPCVPGSANEVSYSSRRTAREPSRVETTTHFNSSLYDIYGTAWWKPYGTSSWEIFPRRPETRRIVRWFRVNQYVFRASRECKSRRFDNTPLRCRVFAIKKIHLKDHRTIHQHHHTRVSRESRIFSQTIIIFVGRILIKFFPKYFPAEVYENKSRLFSSCNEKNSFHFVD